MKDRSRQQSTRHDAEIFQSLELKISTGVATEMSRECRQMYPVYSTKVSLSTADLHLHLVASHLEFTPTWWDLLDPNRFIMVIRSTSSLLSELPSADACEF